MRVDLNTETISPPFCSSDICCSCAHERIKDRITNEAEHPDEPLGKLQGVRRRVQLGRSTRYSGPNLLEPRFMLISWNNAKNSSCQRGTAVTTRLSFH